MGPRITKSPAGRRGIQKCSFRILGQILTFWSLFLCYGVFTPIFWMGCSSQCKWISSMRRSQAVYTTRHSDTILMPLCLTVCHIFPSECLLWHDYPSRRPSSHAADSTLRARPPPHLHLRDYQLPPLHTLRDLPPSPSRGRLLQSTRCVTIRRRAYNQVQIPQARSPVPPRQSRSRQWCRSAVHLPATGPGDARRSSETVRI